MPACLWQAAYLCLSRAAACHFDVLIPLHLGPIKTQTNKQTERDSNDKRSLNERQNPP